VTAGDLRVGGVLTVFPEGHPQAADSQAILIRMEPGQLVVQPGREAWSPDGYVAYSKVCTHAGCPVGLYEQATGQLFCPCHQSVFDAKDGARPTAGPATRPLPQLPLAIDPQGFLTAGGEFPEPVGPGFWNLP
jgi:ubiquinol-cytochrome c reductase iron-sulfur subunit